MSPAAASFILHRLAARVLLIRSFDGIRWGMAGLRGYIKNAIAIGRRANLCFGID
uniref:Uncharacterized protein n=1 Tax=Picea glauca TaxID=3330 RepID=A0A101LZ48_PICGL|nr:hypothetical protein ABT39_MTgene5007 [Picea glauca]QHR86565.1 hypothetical protein Q903MT_gene568 [Picea sitchensis]